MNKQEAIKYIENKTDWTNIQKEMLKGCLNSLKDEDYYDFSFANSHNHVYLYQHDEFGDIHYVAFNTNGYVSSFGKSMYV